MPLHLSSAGKGISKSPQLRSPGTKLASVNRSAGFGIGPGQWKVRDEEHSANLLQRLRLQREKGEFTDITFTYNGESFSANQVVLAALSPVMRNVFSKHEDLLNAEVLPPEALHHVVLFIYNACTEVKLDVIKKIEKASRVLQMSPITTTCTNLLATIPAMQDDDGAAKRLRKMSRHISDSVPGFDPSPLQQLHGDSKSSIVETTDANGVSASDISEILVKNLKKGNRASIRLTFHNQTRTPISRSSDDLSRATDDGGSETTDTQSIDSKDAFKEDALPPDVQLKPPLKETEKLDKIPDEKRKQSISNIFPSFSSKNNSLKADPLNSKSKTPILLSRLLLTSPPTESSNLTWPKRVASPPKRNVLPAQWKNTSGLLPNDSKTNSNQENIKSRDIKKKSDWMRQTRDKYVVRFKSKSIPSLLKGLNSLREQSLLYDVTIVVGNARIRCHKAVLAAGSEGFRAILKSIPSKSIKLTKIDEAVILEMIKFIYTGQCSIDKDNVMGLLHGSRRFGLHFIARKCVGYLDEYAASSQNILSSENVLVAYQLAGEYRFQKLREESKKFAVNRFWELIHSQHFKELAWVDLTGLLSSPPLRIPQLRSRDQELQLFQGLLSWLHYPHDSRVPNMTARAMKFVDFSNMSPDALNQVVTKETSVMQELDVRLRILDALRSKLSSNKKTSSALQAQQRHLADCKKEKEETILAFITENKGENETANQIYKFHLEEGWVKLPSMIVPRSHFSLLPLDGALYAIGGLSEDGDKQYIATTSCETLPILGSPENTKWKMTSWELPTASYSHSATVCNVDLSRASFDNTLSPKLGEARKRGTGSPLRKKGGRFSAPFAEAKSPLLGRIPRSGSGKNKKQANSDAKHQADPSFFIYVCGGKVSPRQHLRLALDSSEFVEKTPLPVPCTHLSVTSHGARVYVACDDVMETSQFRVFEYKCRTDMWVEMKLTASIERPVSSSSAKASPSEEPQPPRTSISCAPTASGICLAICVSDVIVVECFDVTSLKWTSGERTRLKCDVTEFSVCTL